MQTPKSNKEKTKHVRHRISNIFLRSVQMKQQTPSECPNVVFQVSSMLWDSCSPTHPLAGAPAHGGMCLGCLSDGAHHELDQSALLPVRHGCGDNRASLGARQHNGDTCGTAGEHTATGEHTAAHSTPHTVLWHI